MNANALMFFSVLAILGHTKDVMETLVDRAVDVGTNLRSDLDDATLGKGSGGGAAVPVMPSRATNLDAAPSDSQDPYGGLGGLGGGKFQKMLEKFEKIQEKSQKAESHLQKKLGELQNQLTWDTMRPALKKSWQCSLDCADSDSSTAKSDFGSCLDKCNAPANQAQQDLQNYLQQIMQQDQQCSQGCQMQGYGKNQTQTEMMKSQADCAAKCAQDVEAHIPDYKKQIEKFLKQSIDHPQAAPALI